VHFISLSKVYDLLNHHAEETRTSRDSFCTLPDYQLMAIRPLFSSSLLHCTIPFLSFFKAYYELSLGFVCILYSLFEAFSLTSLFGSNPIASTECLQRQDKLHCASHT